MFEQLRPRLLSAHAKPEQAIFRGLGDASHHLLPKAMRGERGVGPAEEVIGREMLLLKWFVESCDRAGLAIPTDGQHFRENLAALEEIRAGQDPEFIYEWPLSDQYEIWAVAQHHGLPTRLLDWSRSPIVALYFAAQSCVITEKAAAALAVWKLVRGPTLERGSPGRIRVVEVPAAHSPNLAAQSGLFTLTIAESIQRGAALDCAPLEQLMERNSRGEAMLFKYELAREHAGDLLELCEGYGVSGATMFPGFDGSCRSVLEREARHLVQRPLP